MTDVQLQSIFTYHAPHGDQAKRYEQVRAAGLRLAQQINALAPESGEKTLAIRRVQEAVMYANAAIACNDPPPVLYQCSKCGLVIPNGEGFYSGRICQKCYS